MTDLKSKLELALETEKRFHINTKKHVKECERNIDELEDQKGQLSMALQEYKDKQDGMLARFKIFADEIAALKLTVFNTNAEM